MHTILNLMFSNKKANKMIQINNDSNTRLSWIEIHKNSLISQYRFYCIVGPCRPKKNASTIFKRFPFFLSFSIPSLTHINNNLHLPLTRPSWTAVRSKVKSDFNFWFYPDRKIGGALWCQNLPSDDFSRIWISALWLANFCLQIFFSRLRKLRITTKILVFWVQKCFLYFW